MRRWRKYDIYLVVVLFVITIGYFVFNQASSESRGVELYAKALEIYKTSDFEKSYVAFGKIPSKSGLKQAALFRQARCATNLDKKELAIKKYKKIIHSHSKSSIVPISEYNMAVLMYEIKDSDAKKSFKRIINKYPSSDYSIASKYYLGMIQLSDMPKSEKKKKKAVERALNYFGEYISNAPDGRYAINSINELLKLKSDLSKYDNYIIAKAYYSNGEYEKAEKFFKNAELTECWADFSRTEFKLNNKDKGRYYSEFGLKGYASNTEQKDVYDVIDNYISSFGTRQEGIKKLLTLDLASTGADYAAYLNCNEVVAQSDKNTCFKALYEKYPNGQFSAEALYNLFLSKYVQKKYYDAQRLGFLHKKKFPHAKSGPAVTYYMAKIALKLKHYDTANTYFKQVISKYPDSYYAFRANANIHRDSGFLPFLQILPRPVIFPYKKSLDNNLVVKLAYLKDYDLIEELCKKDKFIQSWIAYEKGNYTISAVMARNAVDELEEKPDFNDLRWRLVYPVHYYDIINNVKGTNNPVLLESIMKEESHFNPFARSYVGAGGLMQLMPSTYSEVTKAHGISGDIYNEKSNITAGSYYFAGLRHSLVNKDLYALSAYNGGIGSVKKWCNQLEYSDTDEFVEQIPYPETKNYVKKVLRTYWMYGNLYH